MCTDMPQSSRGFRAPHRLLGEQMGDEGTDLGTALIDLSDVSLDDAAKLPSGVLREALRRVLGEGACHPQDVAEFNSSAA
jgi:FXSXX-COOH protein